MTDRELTFYLEKSPQYREIQIDGALGGPAPSGNKITMTVYVERSAIPKELVHNISDKGKMLDEIPERRSGKEGIIRILETTLHMDIVQAKAVNQWLSDQINELEKATGVNHEAN